MINTNAPISDQVVLADTIDPDAYAAGTLTSGWVDMSVYDTVLATVLIGALGTGATVGAKLEQATDASGTGAKDVADKAITPMTEVGGGSGTQALIEIRSEELDVNAAFTHVRLSITVATASCDLAASLHGVGARYQQANAASVAERVL